MSQKEEKSKTKQEKLRTNDDEETQLKKLIFIGAYGAGLMPKSYQTPHDPC